MYNRINSTRMERSSSVLILKKGTLDKIQKKSFAFPEIGWFIINNWFPDVKIEQLSQIWVMPKLVFDRQGVKDNFLFIVCCINFVFCWAIDLQIAFL